MHDESGPVGFLGGSFDPVHIGHLRGAMVVREALNLARVDLVPAAQSPLKPEAMLTGAHRLAMLELAIADVPGLGVDARELDRAGPSFTIDTLEALRAQYGGTRALVWIIGADSLVTLPRWARWRELLTLAHVAVLDRPGSATPSGRSQTGWANIGLSAGSCPSARRGCRHAAAASSRHRVVADTRHLCLGNSPRFLLPDAVMEYIERNALFGPSKS